MRLGVTLAVFAAACAANAPRLEAAWTDANWDSPDGGTSGGEVRNGVFADGIPFSMRGSYFTVGYAGVDPSRPERAPGLWLQTVSSAADERYIARLVPSAEGRELEVASVKKSPGRLVASTVRGNIEVAFADAGTLLVRGTSAALSLRVDFFLPAPYQPIFEVPVKGGGKAVLATANKNGCKILLDVRQGVGKVDCRWGGRNAESSALDIKPAGEGPVEVALRDVSPEWDGTLPRAGFDESVRERESEFAAFLSRVPKVEPRYAKAREDAALLLWSAAVAPRGNLRRESLLMSKNWMNMVWSWDHAFNAVGLSDVDFDLAWDQLMCVFDAQDASGQLPDAMGDGARIFAFAKPPVHGWAIRRMMSGRELSRGRMEDAYRRISGSTRWWLERRDRDGNGLAEYDHGNDSGWDNSTAFLVLPPVETPELQAYLVVQMDVLADLARRLGRNAESEEWSGRADALAKKTVEVLFDAEGNPLARQVATGRVFAPRALQTRLAMLMGKRLPERVRKRTAEEVARGPYRMGHALATLPEGEHFSREGYWRGPVWAPSTMLSVDGLRACGEEKAAREIAREFCDMVAASGFAENFDPVSGAPMCDPAYTWTASVFLTLAHELDAGK